MVESGEIIFGDVFGGIVLLGIFGWRGIFCGVGLRVFGFMLGLCIINFLGYWFGGGFDIFDVGGWIRWFGLVVLGWVGGGLVFFEKKGSILFKFIRVLFNNKFEDFS